jgi:demethylmenaquinone methyltransferase/2-methoxy-6-polyprenyl-1,4-benzoquinol methylase
MSSALQGRKKESWKIFDEIAGTYDLLNRILSCGIDVYWRRKLLKNLPERNNLLALDLATGTGDVPLVLAKSPKIEKITGLDLSRGMVELGKVKVKKAKKENKIALHIGDGCNIPAADSTIDVVTISFGIRNFPDPKKSLREIYRVLKPEGRVMIMEFGLPKNKLVNAVYMFYFRHLLPFVGNLLSSHGDAYTYLNETVEDFAYGEEFTGWMKEAGFINARFEELTFGISNLYIGDKK